MFLETFDIISYLEDKRIEYRTEGKNVSRGWVEVNCPWCDDPSFHLGINLENKYLNCWRCGPKGMVTNYIKTIERCSERQALRIIQQYQLPTMTEIKKETQTSKIETTSHDILPKSAKLPLPKLHREYLIARGFDPEEIARKYKILACENTGSYKFRIIIPVIMDGKIVSFTARDVTGKAETRYKSCPSSKSIRPIKHCLYNYDSIKESGPIIVVEGPLDVWRIGREAVATFGINFTKEQVKLLLQKRPRKVIIVYDGEEKAIRKAYELASLISPFSEVKVVELDRGKDPCDLTEEEINEIRKL